MTPTYHEPAPTDVDEPGANRSNGQIVLSLFWQEEAGTHTLDFPLTYGWARTLVDDLEALLDHDAERYLARPYHFTLVHDTDDQGSEGWVASVQELPGCISQGETPDQAVSSLRDAMYGWITVALADGKIIPRPAPADHDAAAPSTERDRKVLATRAKISTLMEEEVEAKLRLARENADRALSQERDVEEELAEKLKAIALDPRYRAMPPEIRDGTIEQIYAWLKLQEADTSTQEGGASS